jgi:GAF domain-containing protein
MTPAPIPPDDPERIAALRCLLLLDTPPEERFDTLVAFAVREFDVPMVLVSLVDGERQWFKARAGVAVCETPRDISFCGHAILSPQTLIVNDTWLDERFADNPLVTGPPHFRFYAGAPLQLPDGHRVGTLCLMDRAPRQLDRLEQLTLAALAALVVEQLASPPAAL